MSASDRGQGIAPLIEQGDQTEGGDQPASGSNQPSGSQAEEVPVIGERAQGQGEPSTAEAEAEQQQNYSLMRADLEAQQSMAEASDLMALAAIGTLIVTTIGTSFLAWQVYLTRKAVESTDDATKAMVRQNELTEAAQRPFLVVQPVRHTDKKTEKGAPVSFRYVNHGRMPAKVIRHHFEVTKIGKRRPLASRFDPKKKGFNLPDGYVVPAGEASNTIVFADNVASVEAPSLSLDFTKPGPDGFGEHYIWEDYYFLGFVIYGDLGDSYWCRRFCFTSTSDDIALIETSDTLNTEFRCTRDGTPCDGTRHHDGDYRPHHGAFAT